MARKQKTYWAPFVNGIPFCDGWRVISYSTKKECEQCGWTDVRRVKIVEVKP